VTLSFSGLIVRSSGSRLSSTVSSSMAVADRSCGITSPSAMGDPDGPPTATRSTNFSPNRVLGSSRALTSSGIMPALSGCSAMSIVACSPSECTLRTSPTIMPRSLTSAGGASWLPTLSVSNVTCTTSMNALL